MQGAPRGWREPDNPNAEFRSAYAKAAARIMLPLLRAARVAGESGDAMEIVGPTNPAASEMFEPSKWKCPAFGAGNRGAAYCVDNGRAARAIGDSKQRMQWRRSEAPLPAVARQSSTGRLMTFAMRNNN
jgi:hypothetical protein